MFIFIWVHTFVQAGFTGLQRCVEKIKPRRVYLCVYLGGGGRGNHAVSQYPNVCILQACKFLVNV